MSSRRARPTASHRGTRTDPQILTARRPAAAPRSASRPTSAASPGAPAPEPVVQPESATEGKRAPRAARIVASRGEDLDGRVKERERLLGRLLRSEGRGAITRAADEYRRAGFDFPSEQPVQLQLLEHLDEALVRSALDALRDIVQREPPLKRPIFEQRLRRLEDAADEEATRSAASDLRRALRA